MDNKKISVGQYTKKDGTIVSAHTRNTATGYYKPTGRFGAYIMPGYTDHFSVYCNFDEDPLHDGCNVLGYAWGDELGDGYEQAIATAEKLNQMSSKTLAKHFGDVALSFRVPADACADRECPLYATHYKHYGRHHVHGADGSLTVYFNGFTYGDESTASYTYSSLEKARAETHGLEWPSELEAEMRETEEPRTKKASGSQRARSQRSLLDPEFAKKRHLAALKAHETRRRMKQEAARG